MAIGIGGYFSLRFEPDVPFLWAMGALLAVVLLTARYLGEAFGPIAVGVVLILSGFLLAAHRAHDVAGPVLGWRYYGPIEGRVVNLDRSASDALRITLDHVVLKDVLPERTPTRVRISLHGDQTHSVKATPGMRIMTTGHLSPPGGPVEPGGFDFQRPRGSPNWEQWDTRGCLFWRLRPRATGMPVLQFFAYEWGLQNTYSTF